MVRRLVHRLLGVDLMEQVVMTRVFHRRGSIQALRLTPEV